MDQTGARPALLTTAYGPFAASVLAARLRAARIPSVLRGFGDGPYPLPGEVAVLVPVALLETARELLLADAVDAAFAEDEERERPARRSLFRRRAAR